MIRTLTSMASSFNDASNDLVCLCARACVASELSAAALPPPPLLNSVDDTVVAAGALLDLGRDDVDGPLSDDLARARVPATAVAWPDLFGRAGSTNPPSAANLVSDIDADERVRGSAVAPGD
jgi:hypothetical protein